MKNEERIEKEGMEMAKEMLSVIIPIYNCEKYIDDCLESVFSQSYPLYEVIAINDGSTDDSYMRLKKWEEKHSNLNVFHTEHQGVSYARNLGLKHANGEFITFMDADDTLEKGCWNMVENMKKNLELDMMVFGIRYIDLVNKNKSADWMVEDKLYGNPSELADDYIRTGRMLMYANCNKIYRSDIISQHKIRFNTSFDFGEDRLFNWNYLRHCRQIQYVSVLGYHYYRRENKSLSSKYRPQIVDIGMRVHKEKIRCMCELKRTVTEQEWNRFIQGDFGYELGQACKHIAKSYKELSPGERTNELRTLLQHPDVVRLKKTPFRSCSIWAKLIKIPVHMQSDWLLKMGIKMLQLKK